MEQIKVFNHYANEEYRCFPKFFWAIQYCTWYRNFNKLNNAIQNVFMYISFGVFYFDIWQNWFLCISFNWICTQYVYFAQPYSTSLFNVEKLRKSKLVSLIIYWRSNFECASYLTWRATESYTCFSFLVCFLFHLQCSIKLVKNQSTDLSFCYKFIILYTLYCVYKLALLN